MISYQLAMLLLDDDLGLAFEGVVDVATATLIGRWFDPIIVRADTGPITARAETKVGL